MGVAQSVSCFDTCRGDLSARSSDGEFLPMPVSPAVELNKDRIGSWNRNHMETRDYLADTQDAGAIVYNSRWQPTWSNAENGEIDDDLESVPDASWHVKACNLCVMFEQTRTSVPVFAESSEEDLDSSSDDPYHPIAKACNHGVCKLDRTTLSI